MKQDLQCLVKTVVANDQCVQMRERREKGSVRLDAAGLRRKENATAEAAAVVEASLVRRRGGMV